MTYITTNEGESLIPPDPKSQVSANVDVCIAHSRTTQENVLRRCRAKAEPLTVTVNENTSAIRNGCLYELLRTAHDSL